jgi:serine/threonine-protein kinase RsbW
MAPANPNIEITLDTQLESVDIAEQVAVRAAEASGFDEDDVHKIGMAVREGMVNAYNYGNRQDCRKKIQMIIEMKPEKMIIHVLDQGEGFNLADVPHPLAEENLLRTSGRGIFLMRAFMDELAVRSGPHGGAELILVKQLPHHKSGNGNSPKSHSK